MLIAETPGGVLKFDFEGNAVGIAVASGLDAGVIEYRIDKGVWKTQDLFTQWSSQLHLPWFYTLGLRIMGRKTPVGNPYFARKKHVKQRNCL